MANTKYDSSLYCSLCETGFRSVPGYLAHCSTIQHHQRQTQEEAVHLESLEHVSHLSSQRDSGKQPANVKPLLSNESASVKPLMSKESASVKPLLSTSVKEVEPSAEKTTSSEMPQPAKKKKSKSKNKTSEPSAPDIAYCLLCDVNCTGSETFTLHCAGKQHCKKYLLKQNEIGFDEFRLRYGNLAYNKVDSDEPAPEVEDDYVIHAYRSGVFNKLNCRACCTRVYTYSAWYNHILSQEHGEQMIDLLSRHGGAAFMSQFGDLPGPNPNLFDIQDDGLMHKTPMDSAEFEPRLRFRGANPGLAMAAASTVCDWQQPPQALSRGSRSLTDWLAPLSAARYQNPQVPSATRGFQYHRDDAEFNADYNVQRNLNLLRVGGLTASAETRHRLAGVAHDSVTDGLPSTWHKQTMDFVAACNRPAGLHAAGRKRPYESHSPDRWLTGEADVGFAAARGIPEDRYGREIGPATESFPARLDMQLKCFDHRKSSGELTAGRRSPVFADRRQDSSHPDQRQMDSLFSSILQSAGLTQYYESRRSSLPSAPRPSSSLHPSVSDDRRPPHWSDYSTWR